MSTASAIRLQIEAALARKIPAALTPQPKMVRTVVETGIGPLDRLLQGGLPVGAVSELTGTGMLGANFGGALVFGSDHRSQQGLRMD